MEWTSLAFTVRDAHDFVWATRRAAHDRVIYQMGNAWCHDYMWPYLFRWPGLVVLHDAHLHHARAWSLLRRKRFADYRAELAFNHPELPPEAAEPASTDSPGPSTTPGRCSETVFSRHAGWPCTTRRSPASCGPHSLKRRSTPSEWASATGGVRGADRRDSGPARHSTGRPRASSFRRRLRRETHCAAPPGPRGRTAVPACDCARCWSGTRCPTSTRRDRARDRCRQTP